MHGRRHQENVRQYYSQFLSPNALAPPMLMGAIPGMPPVPLIPQMPFMRPPFPGPPFMPPPGGMPPYGMGMPRRPPAQGAPPRKP
ncbi:hypothetical protein AAMO2058_001342500 [Amorphochlora amoebiformis]